ncbi:hypothetical protein Psfp_02746 [Pelotomaculum sp. FP]|uniref:hypothetical protein n=1 Tax=Pelotomaculum sp. FP TaxID=261474 RepID=UPI00106473A4|nr:hypothetical protein [Pelotomaculum sp. FP]TEB14605.1 hypothetical protein Psfp_02746 [Pelotomaculum sp. FP]
MNTSQVKEIPVKIQEWIATSKKNEAMLCNAGENLVIGKITVEEFRAIIVDLLDSHLNMKAQLKEYIADSKGAIKRQAKSSLRDCKGLIKTIEKLIFLIDQGEVFE